MMAVSRWWQLAIGAAVGSVVVMLMPVTAFFIAIVLGALLAWAGLTHDGDDAMTAMAAGFLTGVLGCGLFRLTATLTGSPF